ncbi:MAG: hypothetical protein C7N36_10410 [Bacteroidetes bacterium]|nr:MAG: hypothetical protein C7N36_10410 [Bacteroidota bacterium]
MKTIFFSIALLLGIMTNVNAQDIYLPVNYYAEYADLLHTEMAAKAAPVGASHTNRFPAFVHYREVMKGKAEDFLAYYEKIAPRKVPPTKTAFTTWRLGQGCPHDAPVFDYTVFTNLPAEDCSGR